MVVLSSNLTLWFNLGIMTLQSILQLRRGTQERNHLAKTTYWLNRIQLIVMARQLILWGTSSLDIVWCYPIRVLSFE